MLIKQVTGPYVETIKLAESFTMGMVKDLKEELRDFCETTSIQGLRNVADQVC